jgi:hypothetical protein
VGTVWMGFGPFFSQCYAVFIDNHYLGRWIGRSEPDMWPPRSPSLTSVDLCLWALLTFNDGALGTTVGVPLQRLGYALTVTVHRCNIFCKLFVTGQMTFCSQLFIRIYVICLFCSLLFPVSITC